MQVGESIGLSLNLGKSEVICGNEETAAHLQVYFRMQSM